MGADINLSRYVAFNVEVNANMMSDHFNSKRGGSVDWQFNALAGFTFKFGKGTRKVSAVYEELPPAPVAAVPVKGGPTTSYNKTLSERRAKAVGDALLDAGISADRISMSGKGDSEQPFVQNDDNRVVIMIAE